MDTQRWQRVSQLFEQLIDLPPAQRERVLDQHCGGDGQLRQQVLRMLQLDESPHLLDQGVGVVIDRVGSEAEQEDADEQWIQQSAGERLGVWQLQGVLGKGGSGAVFLAHRDDDSGQRAAIKRLRARWDGSVQALRFLQERRILASLSHPNIPRLIDHGLDTDMRPWFALELVEGVPITTWADAQRLSLPARIELMQTVCAAVQHAHARFVVHRDLKPGNILVNGEGHPMVLDFGAAKRLDLLEGQTQTGLMAGFTPEYAAPEQISAGVITAATDVYALGVVLYQLLTGRLPYAMEPLNLRRMTEVITEQAPLRVDQALAGEGEDVQRSRLQARRTDLSGFRRYVRGDLARILQTALAKEPERRYASVEDLSRDLRRFAQGRPVSVSGDTFAYRARKFVQRNRLGVAMATLALAAVIGGGLVSFVQMRKAQGQRDMAMAEARRNDAVREYMMLMFRNSSASQASDALSAHDVLASGAAEVAKHFSADPLAGADMLRMLAELYLHLGDITGAEPLLTQALSMVPDKQRPEDIAQSQYLQAVVAINKGDTGQARKLIDQAVATWEKNPSANRLRLNQSLSILSRIERAEGDVEKGIATLRRALSESIELRGVDDWETLTFQNNLANALTTVNDIDEALKVAEEGYARIQALGLQQSQLGLALLNARGHALMRQGKYTDAAPLMEQAYTLRRDNYGRSAVLGMAQSNYGRALLLTGHPEQAVAQLRPALVLLTEFTSAQAPPTLQASVVLADALLASGHAADAKAELAKVEAAVVSKLPPTSGVIAYFHVVSSGCERALGNTAHARAAAERARLALEQAKGVSVDIVERVAALQTPVAGR